ncbi:helicase [Phenylobacterium sp. J367]|uniref:helicase n=1 Tax=Phenylobacterium sp. J367 TaxID=2898435 RepID=UPI002151B2E8|nr:helicase [Phenylobacterium sp. J367]MCR5879991.1 helicase [Phenylobacterium sp. J367]
MDSRRKTGVEGVRLPELSRRAVIAGTSVAALGAAKPVAATGAIPPAATLVPSDEGTRRCARWLAIEAKIARLQTRWAKLETWLAKNHNWFRLSPAEQQALPWAKELRDIDGCLDVLFEQREAALKSIPSSGSADLESIIAKLAVVERLIWREEHPEVHALITGARRDLTAMSRRHSETG